MDGAGLLRSCRIQGHGGAGGQGSDVACAAVSVLAKTVIKVLSGREGVVVRGSIPERGDFFMETEYTPEGRDFLAGAGAFLMDGLSSVSEEYPGNCKVILERRNSYGA